MYFVAIESQNDGELNHLVGPFEDEAGERWMEDFLAHTGYDADFVYVLHTTSPDSPELADFYEESA